MVGKVNLFVILGYGLLFLLLIRDISGFSSFLMFLGL